MTREQKKIQLMFGDSDSFKDKPVSRRITNDSFKHFVASMGDIADWFNKFHIESIELSISGSVATGGILKLFVSAKGESGLKVKLIPKSAH